MVNIVVIGGNLTKAPELKYTPKGTAVCAMRIACNESYRTATGEKRESVLFIDVTAWGRQAESCAEYLDKGSRVLVEGALKSREWDDTRTGQHHIRIDVQAKSVQFLSASKKPGASSADNITAPPVEPVGPDDDVPF